MDGTEHEDRRRRLQRIVYGADAAPDERAAAEAELQELTDAAASASGVSAVTAAVPPGDAAPHDPGPASQPGDADGPDRRAAATTAVRWAIGAGVAALVIGIVVGIGVSALTAAPEVPASAGALGDDAQADSAIDPSALTGPGTPVELTPVYEVFAREQRPSDALPDDMLMGSDLDPTSARLLLIRSDGAQLYAAKTDTGIDMCIVVVVPDIGGGSACTDGGILPPPGIIVSFGFGEQGSEVTASLHPDGTAGLSAAAEPAAG
ncbi:hypothetical protein [Agromyces sp. NPDC058064]|uniref:hypothetical protein n=1 Tax=Agromyces sp. NPDC058064 TaxID=3346322 RepID=UPI0036DCF36E